MANYVFGPNGQREQVVGDSVVVAKTLEQRLREAFEAGVEWADECDNKRRLGLPPAPDMDSYVAQAIKET